MTQREGFVRAGVVLPAGCGGSAAELRKAEQSHSTSEPGNDLTFATRYAPAVCLSQTAQLTRDGSAKLDLEAVEQCSG
jgi:hypothetical protein